jgi:hypothetical protein
MKRQTLFFGIFATTILIVPAFAGGENAGIIGTYWGRNAFGFEPLPSGPQPVTNLKRRRDGTSDGTQLVGPCFDRTGVENANHWNGRLLRPRRKWPSHHSGQPRDEFSATHGQLPIEPS